MIHSIHTFHEYYHGPSTILKSFPIDTNDRSSNNDTKDDKTQVWDRDDTLDPIQ